ncbi:MAG: ATP-binding protein [Acidobacteriota bacterium]
MSLEVCKRRERRVRFFTAAELTNTLVEAKQAGRRSRKLEQRARFELVIVDELGYVPFDQEGANLLFGFITKVYERRSLVVTTNLAFSRWSEVFLDATAAAAVIDRIIHHATVLKPEGESFRLRAAKAPKRKRRQKVRS